MKICILRAILFLAYPTHPPAHKVLLGGAWGGAGELMPLDGGEKGGEEGATGESGVAEIIQISFLKCTSFYNSIIPTNSESEGCNYAVFRSGGN